MNKEEFVNYLKARTFTLEDLAKIVKINDYSCRSVNVRRGLPGVIIIETKGGRLDVINAALEQYKPIGIEFDVRKVED